MSSAKDKMYNYEVTPPAGTWDKIVIDLDEAELASKFPDRLYDIETAPPPHSWEKIKAHLNTTEEPAIPLFKRIRPFVRYAAAAVFIGAVAFGIIKMTTGSENTPYSTAQTEGNKDSSESGRNKAGIGKEIQATAKSAIEEDNAAPEQNKNVVTKLVNSVKTIRRKPAVGGTPVSYTNSLDSELRQSLYAYEDHVPKLADNYVMLMTPDGNIIRMSKKWSQLLCCVSGEEQDADCKDQLKKWQQKMATSSLAPSPGNFMDILGMVNSLNEGSEL